MSIEKEALSAIGRWINASALRDDVVQAMQEGRMAEEDEQGTKVICEMHQAEKGLRAFWALYGSQADVSPRTREEDRKLGSLALGLLSRAYELEVGKDITREQLEFAFCGRPELENLKAAIAAFFREAIRSHQ